MPSFQYRNSHYKIRWSDHRLTFIMKITIPGKIALILRLSLVDLAKQWVKFTTTCEQQYALHYNDVIMDTMRLKSPASRLFTQHLFKRRSEEISKFRVTSLCTGNSPVTGEFPAQRASNAEIVSSWWRYHGFQFSNKEDEINITINRWFYL